MGYFEVKCIDCKKLGEIKKMPIPTEEEYYACDCNIYNASVPAKNISKPMICRLFVPKEE